MWKRSIGFYFLFNMKCHLCKHVEGVTDALPQGDMLCYPCHFEWNSIYEQFSGLSKEQIAKHNQRVRAGTPNKASLMRDHEGRYTRDIPFCDECAILDFNAIPTILLRDISFGRDMSLRFKRDPNKVWFFIHRDHKEPMIKRKLAVWHVAALMGCPEKALSPEMWSEIERHSMPTYRYLGLLYESQHVYNEHFSLLSREEAEKSHTYPSGFGY